MCNIKQGANVKTIVDLQDLVIGVILRQTSEFSIDDIYNEVRARLTGSDYYDNSEVRQHCEDTIRPLFNINFLHVLEDGKYQLATSFPAVTKR